MFPFLLFSESILFSEFMYGCYFFLGVWKNSSIKPFWFVVVTRFLIMNFFYKYKANKIFFFILYQFWFVLIFCPFCWRCQIFVTMLVIILSFIAYKLCNCTNLCLDPCYLPELALNLDPPDLCFWSSWVYRYAPHSWSLRIFVIFLVISSLTMNYLEVCCLKSGVMVHTCDLSTEKVEAGGLARPRLKQTKTEVCCLIFRYLVLFLGILSLFLI
jgi:hypothetical protein